jgi:hypothetical protein
MKILIVYYSLYGDVFSWHKLSKKVSSRLKEPKCHSVAWSHQRRTFDIQSRRSAMTSLRLVSLSISCPPPESSEGFFIVGNGYPSRSKKR